MTQGPTLGPVTLVPVTLDDADFIVNVRSDAVSKGFLKKGAETAEMQRVWLAKYFERRSPDQDFYFVITSLGQKCGTLRVSLLDPSNENFTWGSWCLAPGLDPLVAIASYLLAFEVGFSHGRKQHALFEVHRDNHGVIAFHRRMGAVETGTIREDQIEFRMSREAFDTNKSRWLGKFR